jgi:NADH:ubiquinone oxidoreductase subunit F (NADH-binding)/(2Fe-2S) ferredoxin/NAD-dependent dihydropyrimidine dehydrogenase PreA subunit
MDFYRSHVLICAGTGCTSSDSRLLRQNLYEEIIKRGLEKEVKVIETGCFGFCNMGPIMVIYPEGTFYCQVKPQDAAQIVEEHLIKGRPVERLLYQHEKENTDTVEMENIEFFKHQKRVALHNCGLIDPENIEEYIAQDGYFALAHCLKELTPYEVIEIIKKSGLRGRGGGGFPTGTKWEFAYKVEDDQKYVVCNADEGDPGAFMDRSILEGDPHSVLEAMTIAGYAIGASKGFIYVRAEYPIAVERLKTAIKQAKEYGLQGKNIFGSDFSFEIDIRLGAGAFVCGEETALLASTEGRRGEPRPRPPFPAVKGLFGKPTIINNVETYANVPQIIRHGWEWFASMGTEKSKGTKVFALAGKINNIGLIEIPMGTTLRTIVYDIGGGIPKGKKFKAAQTGGPSGGCLTEEHLDVPIDYDNLTAAGSMMGSGGLIVMDEDNCMVDIARFFLEFTQEESCGKCPPCRIGTKRMLEILNKITEGKGTPEDLDNLEILANTIRSSSLCALGQTAPNPVLSTLKHFRKEYEAHIYEKRCPAGVCQALLSYHIDPLKCKGCSLCARNCPVGCISGKVKEPYVIDTNKCIKCGECMNRCKFGAVSKK